jgi:hypothetical protein
MLRDWEQGRTAGALESWPQSPNEGQGRSGRRLIPTLFGWRDFRFPVFDEKIIEGFGHKALQGGVPLNGQLLQLIPYLFREVPCNGLCPCPTRLRVSLLFGGLLNHQLWGGGLPSAAPGISQHVCEIGSSVHYRRFLEAGLDWSGVGSVVVDGADDEEAETEDRCGAEGED